MYIIALLLRNKSLAPIRLQYKINYQCITFLIACYTYNKYVSDSFTMSKIVHFTDYWTTKQVKVFISQLIDVKLLIPLAGFSWQRYKTTDKCTEIINQIEQSYDKTVYNFCRLYNIDL